MSDNNQLTYLLVGIHIDSAKLFFHAPALEWKVSHADLSKNLEQMKRLTSIPNSTGDLIAPEVVGFPFISDVKILSSVQKLLVYNEICRIASAVLMKPTHFVATSLVSSLSLEGTEKRTDLIISLYNALILLCQLEKQSDIQGILSNPLAQDMLLPPHVLVAILGAQNQLNHRVLVDLLAHQTVQLFVSHVTDRAGKKQKIFTPTSPPKFDFATVQTLLSTELNQTCTLLSIIRVLGSTSLSDTKMIGTEIDKIASMTRDSVTVLKRTGGIQLMEQIFKNTLPADMSSMLLEFLGSEALIQELTHYAFHATCRIYALQNALPWIERLKQVVPLPCSKILRQKVESATKAFEVYQQIDALTKDINVHRLNIGTLQKSRKESVRALTRSCGKPQQNCDTKTCSMCGDQFPLHKEFKFDDEMKGVKFDVCPPCIVSGISEKCGQCIESKDARCASCTVLRTRFGQPVRRIFVSKSGRWFSYQCAKCHCMYYNQISKPKSAIPECAYCRVGKKSPYVNSALASEHFTAEDTPEIIESKKKINELDQKILKQEQQLSTVTESLTALNQKRISNNTGADEVVETKIQRQQCCLCSSPTDTLISGICVGTKCKDKLASIISNYEKLLNLEILSVPVRKIDVLPRMYGRANFEAVKRPWLNATGVQTNSLNFSDIVPWTYDDLQEGDTKFLAQYNQLSLSINMSGNNTTTPFVARDRPNCAQCVGICKHNWYPAYLTVREVRDALETKSESKIEFKTETNIESKKNKIIVIVFPGWRPSIENQVTEDELYHKRVINCPALARDLNIRVFTWSELSKLAGQIGVRK